MKNGGFEIYSQCPFNFDQIRFANYWDAIDTNYTFDSTFYWERRLGDFYAQYVNTCDTESGRIAAVPANPKFNHYPHSGNGMAYAAMFFHLDDTVGSSGNQINYVQGHLQTHLQAGKDYCVTFYVLSIGAYSINKIGAYLDDGSIDTTLELLKCLHNLTQECQ